MTIDPAIDDWRGEYRGPVPRRIATCGWCGGELYVVGVPAMEAPDRGIVWRVTEVEVECETEPDIDDSTWEDWFRSHSDMPYVNALPQHERIIAWLNRRRRTNR